MSYWIFQANPALYRIFDALGDADAICYWTVTRYQHDIAPGDQFALWASGPKAGVFAFGVVIAAAKLRQGDPNPYGQGPEEDDGPVWQIRIRIKDVLKNPIPRSEIAGDPDAIIRLPGGGSSFLLNEIQWQAICSNRAEGISNHDANPNSPFGGNAQDPSRCEAAYQVLSDRIGDNFDLQWRGPTFALTAQSFLFIGFLTATSNHVIQAVLAVLIVVVGVAAALLMARVQCLIAIDQALLDKYGKILLGNDSELLLHHAQRVKLRARETKYSIPRPSRLLLKVTPTPIMLWIITLLALSGAGIYLLWALHFKYIT